MAQHTGKLTEASRLPARKSQGTGGAVAGTLKTRPRRDVVDTVWTLFCSIRFAVVLNVALALAAMLGTVIPQMPAGIQNFPTELSNYLDGMTARYGDVSHLLYWAGFYNLYTSLWFRMLVVLVIFGIVMCTLNRWQPIMRLITKPTVRASETFMTGLTEKAQFRAVPLDVATTESVLRKALNKSRYRVLAEEGADGTTLHLYGDRDRWSKLVTFVSHAALVLLILAAAGMANLGWREQSVYFAPGEPINVGHGTDFSVRNDHFSIDYYDDGTTVKEYRDTLAVVEGGKDVLTKTIIVNDPLRYKGINFFLVSYQPVLYVGVTDQSGEKLSMRRMGQTGLITDTLPSGDTLVDFKYNSSDNLPMDLVQLPGKDHVLTLELTYYQDVQRGDNENPPVYVKAYVDKNFDTRVYDAFLPRTGTLQIPGFETYHFTFRKDTMSILEVAKDPGLELVGSLFFIMTAGFTLSLYTTFVRCWARISPNEDRPGTLNIMVGGLAEKNKVTFEKDFEKLAARIKEGLQAAVAPNVREEVSNDLERGVAAEPAEA